jgi:hypothetical protein
MKRNILTLILLVFAGSIFAQDFGFWASAVALKNSNYGFPYTSSVIYYDTYDTTDNNRFANDYFSDDVITYFYLNFDTSLGAFAQNSGGLQLQGGLIKTFKNNNSNVCSTTLYYTVYPQGSRPASPVFTPLNFQFLSNCTGNTFPYDGSACGNGDQEWGDTSTINGVDLTTLGLGTYTLETYFRVTGAYNSTSDCSDTVYDNNSNPAGNYQMNFTITNALPVSLLNFSGVYQNNAVALNWSDVNEINIKGFETDRSMDGKTFTAVGFTNAKNKATASYAFADNKLPAAVSTLYYRLKIEGNDGRYSYSSIVPVNLGNSKAFTAQLTKNNLTVYINSAIGNNSFVSLTDMLGRTIAVRSLSAQPAGSSISIPLSEPLSKAVYIVSLYNGASGNVLNKKAEPSY